MECRWGSWCYLNLGGGGSDMPSLSFVALPYSLSLSWPAFLPSPGLPEGGRFSFSDMSPESPALPQGEMQCHFLSCKVVKVLRLAEVCSGLPLCPHSPSERSGWVPLAATCLSECSFAQLAGHHLGITPVPVLSHVRLNFKNHLQKIRTK